MSVVVGAAAEVPNKEPAGFVVSGTAGFAPPKIGGAVAAGALALGLLSGDVLISSTSLLTLRRGFWVVELAGWPKLKIGPVEALFDVDGVNRGAASFLVVVDCPNPNELGALVVAGVDWNKDGPEVVVVDD